MILWVTIADLSRDFSHIYNTSMIIRLSGNLSETYLEARLSTKFEMNCGISQTI